MNIEWTTCGPVTGVELAALFQHAPWAKPRTTEQLDRMLTRTSVWITARGEGRLVRFARAITDGVFRALIDDVVVAADVRGRGAGRELMRQLLACLEVEEVALTSAPEMELFYVRLGFARYGGLTMKKSRGRSPAAVSGR